MAARKCYFHWCGKPAKFLPNKMLHATKDPFFCSYTHAAYFALIIVGDNVHYCAVGEHYLSGDSSEGCSEHDAKEPKEDE